MRTQVQLLRRWKKEKTGLFHLVARSLAGSSATSRDTKVLSLESLKRLGKRPKPQDGLIGSLARTTRFFESRARHASPSLRLRAGARIGDRLREFVPRISPCRRTPLGNRPRRSGGRFRRGSGVSPRPTPRRNPPNSTTTRPLTLRSPIKELSNVSLRYETSFRPSVRRTPYERLVSYRKRLRFFVGEAGRLVGRYRARSRRRQRLFSSSKYDPRRLNGVTFCPARYFRIRNPGEISDPLNRKFRSPAPKP